MLSAKFKFQVGSSGRQKLEQTAKILQGLEILDTTIVGGAPHPHTHTHPPKP